MSWASVARRTSVTPPGEELVWNNHVLYSGGTSGLSATLGSLQAQAVEGPPHAGGALVAPLVVG